MNAVRHWPVFVRPGQVRLLERVVVVRVHAEERSSTREQYHLGKVVGSPWQLQETCELHGNTYEPGWWVFDMQWFYRQEQLDGEALRAYTLGKSPSDKLMYNLAAVVGNVGPVRFEKKIKVSTSDWRFYLSEREHDRILLEGDLGS